MATPALGDRVSSAPAAMRRAVEIVVLFEGTVLEVRHLFPDGKSGFTVGPAPGTDLSVAVAPAPSFPLLRPAGGGFELLVAPGMSGDVDCRFLLSWICVVSCGGESGTLIRMSPSTPFEAPDVGSMP